MVAWRGKFADGSRAVVFRRGEGNPATEFFIPCGTCLGCRLEYARQWAVRCMHEVKWQESQGMPSVFLTLTYDDGRLPPGGSLRPEDMVLFLKRLRKSIDVRVRYFQAGEYGDRTERPHHHMLLFGYDFPDRMHFKGDGDSSLSTSSRLESLWGHGFCSIGRATFDSAGYIARYSLKKLEVNPLYWVDSGRVSPYLTMSRRPGIGANWWLQYASDWYAQDAVVVNGVKCRPPKYYDGLVEKFAPSFMSACKARRADTVDGARAEDNYRRGWVREEVKAATLRTLKREEI